jgi:hypothetical protein
MHTYEDSIVKPLLIVQGKKNKRRQMQGEDGHQAFHLAPVTLSDICRSK